MSLLRSLFVAAAAVTLMACPTDSPTQPEQNPQPVDTQASAVWIIDVQTTDAKLEEGESAIIGISVTRASDGMMPPDNSSIIVSTSLGDLGTAGSGVRTTALTVFEGVAAVELFAGEQAGTAVVQAQLEQSFGEVLVQFVAPDPFIVFEVDPNRGRAGDVVSIIGTGFASPARVFIGGEPAEILSLSNKKIDVRVPPYTATEQSVDVTVIINFGYENEQTFTLTSGFIVLPEEVEVFVVTGVTPGSGVQGDTVTITGVGFRSIVQVLFGNSSAQDVTLLSSEEIEVTVPAFDTKKDDADMPPDTLTSGLVDVTVFIKVGTVDEASRTLPNGFLYN